MADRPAYLIFDLESIVDGRLIQRVRYPDEPALSPQEAVARQRVDLLAASNGRSDFIPHTFHLPVSIAIVKVAGDGSFMEAKTLDRPKFRPQVIARAFWKGWLKYGQPTLVTFNGRFFDLPVLEMAAYRFGIPLPEWFASDGPSYQQPRNRYNQRAHLDLQEVLTNQGAVHQNGGLDLCAKLLGSAGKMDTKGHMVQDLWEAGERERIDDYCLCDALDTYRTFLRIQLLTGRIQAADEQRFAEGARTWVSEHAPRSVAIEEWLRRTRAWEPYGDDDEPFVR
jgi:predicted PolB exonuclease-like 3'-5' exonuclease